MLAVSCFQALAKVGRSLHRSWRDQLVRMIDVCRQCHANVSLPHDAASTATDPAASEPAGGRCRSPGCLRSAGGPDDEHHPPTPPPPPPLPRSLISCRSERRHKRSVARIAGRQPRRPFAVVVVASRAESLRRWHCCAVTFGVFINAGSARARRGAACAAQEINDGRAVWTCRAEASSY